MIEPSMRVAATDDAEQIAPIHAACWHEAYSGLVPQRCLDEIASQDRVAIWRERLSRPGDTTTLAFDGSRLIGLATVGPGPNADIPELPPEELRSLYVERSAWGHGIGRALLHRALVDRPASLWVFEDNVRARAFYAKAGWKADGERCRDEWTGAWELRLLRAQGRQGLARLS